MSDTDKSIYEYMGVTEKQYGFWIENGYFPLNGEELKQGEKNEI